jgi:membrane associated rhomboid family serine protease
MGQRDYFDKNFYKKPTLGQTNNALVILFAANAFIFLILNFLKIVYALDYGSAAETMFQKKILFWFTLSPQSHQIMIKPWTLLVYMFSHYSTIGFISNMLWLWAFGYVLQDLVGNKKLIPLYLYGGLVGGILFIISATYIPVIQQNIDANYLLEGCNASVVAVAIGTTTLSPKYKMFQHIGSGFSLWILTLIFIAVDISFVGFSSLAIIIAHLGAAIIGYIFIKQLQNGNDWSKWMIATVNWIDDLFNPEKKQQRTKQTDKIFYKTNEPIFSKTVNVTESRINEILEKISNKGYNKLSQEEKDFLERASKEVD